MALLEKGMRNPYTLSQPYKSWEMAVARRWRHIPLEPLGTGYKLTSETSAINIFLASRGYTVNHSYNTYVMAVTCRWRHTPLEPLGIGAHV